MCEGCLPRARLWLGTSHSWAPFTQAYRHLDGPGPELGGIPGFQQVHSRHYSTLYGWGNAALLSYLIPLVLLNLAF